MSSSINNSITSASQLFAMLRSAMEHCQFDQMDELMQQLFNNENNVVSIEAFFNELKIDWLANLEYLSPLCHLLLNIPDSFREALQMKISEWDKDSDLYDITVIVNLELQRTRTEIYMPTMVYH